MTTTKTHLHTLTDELHVYFIPADTDLPMGMKVIPNMWRSVKNLIGGYIEQVVPNTAPELYCGCEMAMLVDEEGSMKQLPENIRAGILHQHRRDVIRGDVVLVGLGMVQSNDGEEPSWFSLPQALTAWEGPGNPLPRKDKQPWES